jgi:lytTr DNA-binding domain
MYIGGEIMKILVCEENGDYVDHLIEKLKSFPCDEELVFESYTQTPGVAKRLEREEYDMAFLGGIINGRNGFELGKMLKEKNPDCILFFVCDDYKYMHEVFRADGFQLLMKPQEKLLASEFQRALEVYKKLHFQIHFFSLTGEVLNLVPSEIEYIETGMRETVVVTTKGRYKGFFEDLKRTKQMLVEYHFFQMHPRYFVNMEHIELIKSGELRLDNGDSVPTSAMNKEVIDDAIQSFLNCY